MRLGLRGCQHLGYADKRLLRRHSSGVNQRVVDGHVAHRLTMEAMLDAGVDGIVDGGDLFHVSRPLPRDIEVALRTDDLRMEQAKRPRLLANSGNHDADSGAGLSAVATIHRPSLGAHAVFPQSPDGCGPTPGYYEVHHIEDVALHVVSHYGLDPSVGERLGFTVSPQPDSELDGSALLLAHGVFVADERLRLAAERHGAERTIPQEWVERFPAAVLSDFHVLGPVPGQNRPVWYTGSSLTRGYSDAAGERGWILAELDAGCAPMLTAQPIWQRPQATLEPIDAREMSAVEVDDQVRAALSERQWWDERSETLTGDGGWLLRVRIEGASPATRSALGARRVEWTRCAQGALQLLVEHSDGSAAPAPAPDSHKEIGTSVRDLEDELSARVAHGRIKALLDGAPAPVGEQALALVKTALRGSDRGTATQETLEESAL